MAGENGEIPWEINIHVEGSNSLSSQIVSLCPRLLLQNASDCDTRFQEVSSLQQSLTSLGY